jgi:proteic killer suppression protein
MIKTFACKEMENIFQGRFSRRLPQDIQRSGHVKLLMLNAAPDLESLRIPPGNRLEALGGDRAGQYGIRINDQWRICFRWLDGNVFDVEITDYH